MSVTVKIINTSEFPIYPDLDGNKETKDMIFIGPKDRKTVTLPNERRFVKLKAELSNRASIRKV